ncbi:MAG: DUF3046 domain-containing protein [Aquiluna sp.]
MTLSRFHELMLDEFGPLADAILSDLRLDTSDQTPSSLLDKGIDPKEVWLAICAQLGVPKERWQGKLKTPRHAD